MNRIIQIDDNARIKIIANNFMLQYRKKTRTKRIAWHTEGFYPDLASMCQSYLNGAPYRAIHSRERIETLLEVVRQTEETLRKIIKKLYGTH